jgi:hypothetical protein
MKRLTQILVIGALVALLTILASAQVPQMINYQGKLTTNTGAPVNDTLQVVFTIYADEAGTTPLWTETQPTVVVEKGVFNVLLGSVDSIPYSVFDGSIRYLGVKVGDDPEITPRKPMVSVAYAYRAGTADGGGNSGWVDDGAVVRLADSTDNVGIGTTSPGFKLEVRSTNAGQAAYIRSDAATGTNYGVDAEAMGVGATTNIGGWFTASGATNNYAIIVPQGHGNVGIGTESPSGKLEVVGSTYLDGHTWVNGILALGDNQGAGIAEFGTDGLGFRVGDIADKVVIDNTGNVGIGTTSPGAKLDVNGHARFSSTELYGYGQYTYHDLTVGGSQSDLRWIKIPYQDGSPIRFTVFRHTHENGAWSGQLAATISTTIGNWGSLSGNTFIRVEKAEFPAHLLRRVISCECQGGGESGIYLQVLGGRTYHFYGLPDTPTDFGPSDPSCPNGSRDLSLSQGSGVWFAPSLVVSSDIWAGGTIHGNFDGTINNALLWNGHSWGEAYPSATNADIWDGHHWGDTYPYSSNSDLVDGIHGTQFLRNDQSGTLSDSVGDYQAVLNVLNRGEGRSIYASTKASMNRNAAIYGDALDDGGVGVYGHTSSTGVSGGSSVGVFGLADTSISGGSTGGAAMGVFGRVTSYQKPGNSVPVGVFGETMHPTGIAWGVAGETWSTNVAAAGVKGTLKASNAEGRAIWGEAPTTGWAGYFQGKVHVQSNVGIGTASPGSYLLAVNGSAAKPGGGSWDNFSDVRLKEVSGRYNYGLSEIAKLTPVRYSYKRGNELGLASDKKYVGLVAQEVQTVIPDAIQENDKGYLMLNNDPIIWAMLNAIKQLKAENEELKQRIEVLESK